MIKERKKVKEVFLPATSLVFEKNEMGEMKEEEYVRDIKSSPIIVIVVIIAIVSGSIHTIHNHLHKPSHLAAFSQQLFKPFKLSNGMKHFGYIRRDTSP